MILGLKSRSLSFLLVKLDYSSGPSSQNQLKYLLLVTFISAHTGPGASKEVQFRILLKDTFLLGRDWLYMIVLQKRRNCLVFCTGVYGIVFKNTRIKHLLTVCS